MRIIYHIASVHHPGGMERVLLNKVRWFVAQGGYELMVVTTDQQGLPPFYDFPPQVRMVDLGIGYSLDNGRNSVEKILSYFRKRHLHRRRLTELLMQERADIVVSLFPTESSFIPSIRDGSKKVLELHYNRYFRLQYSRKGLLGLADRFRMWQDECLVRRFDRFVVLTQEDAGYWGALPNIQVIPNAALQIPEVRHDPDSRRVIAVGRLDYQKGFDRLLDAWALLPEDLRQTWRLDIFGQGEWETMLKKRIASLGIFGSAEIHAPTTRIFAEYATSAFLVMSSHYEGFPMVLVEAMACGLPGVCFGFKCGPKDILCDGVNGRIVPEGDIPALAGAMEELMRNDDLRKRMGEEARKVTQTYSEQNVMEQWKQCFDTLLQK